MNGLHQINQSHGFVPQLSKSSKGKGCLLLLKREWSLSIERLSINVTLKLLLLVERP